MGGDGGGGGSGASSWGKIDVNERPRYAVGVQLRDTQSVIKRAVRPATRDPCDPFTAEERFVFFQVKTASKVTEGIKSRNGLCAVNMTPPFRMNHAAVAAKLNYNRKRESIFLFCR